MERVIARRGNQLLVAIDSKQGYVLDATTRYPTLAIGSITARGYWEPHSLSSAELQRRLSTAKVAG